MALNTVIQPQKNYCHYKGSVLTTSGSLNSFFSPSPCNYAFCIKKSNSQDTPEINGISTTDEEHYGE